MYVSKSVGATVSFSVLFPNSYTPYNVREGEGECRGHSANDTFTSSQHPHSRIVWGVAIGKKSPFSTTAVTFFAFYLARYCI